MSSREIAGLPGRDIPAECGCKPGQKFLYLFDYGDNWEFDIKLLSINENAPEGDYPKLIESKGRAPEQYPNYEE